MQMSKNEFYNWEDLHEDKELRFQTSCSTLWFDRRCRQVIDTCFIDFIPESGKHALYIHDDDIGLMTLAISPIIGEQFDEYGEYELSYEQWISVLDQADRLVGFGTYEELCGYFIRIKEESDGKCDLLYWLEHNGKEFWEKIELHEQETKDIRRWTLRALMPGEKMTVIGF